MDSTSISNLKQSSVINLGFNREQPYLGQLRILQINLQFCRAASAALVLFCDKYDIDVALIQDFYHIDARLSGIPSGWGRAVSKNWKAGILVRNNNIETIIVDTLEHSVFVSIYIENKNIILGSAYFSPSMELQSGINEMQSILVLENLVIAGDFNAKNELWGYLRNDLRGEIMISTAIQNDLVIINDPEQPQTFFQLDCGGYPDLTLCSGGLLENITAWKVHDSELSLSDHRYITYGLSLKKEIKNERIRYKSRFCNKKLLERDLKKCLVYFKNKFSDVLDTEALEEIMVAIEQKLIEICDKNFKRRVARGKVVINWWNKNLRALRNKLKALYRSYKRNNKQEVLLNYKKTKAQYKREINNSRKESWKIYCNNVMEKYGNTFKIFRSKGETLTVPLHVRILDSPLQFSKKDQLESLIDYHFGGSVNLVGENITLGKVDRINLSEVIAAIDSMNPNKAPGPDNIDLRIVKFMLEVCPNLLVEIYGLLLDYSYFPRCWKKGELVFFAKNNKPLDNLESYRPICLINVISKIFEKIINNRLRFKLNEAHFFHCNQYGFSEGISTSDCLRDLLLYIENNRNEYKYITLIVVDIKGAFNSVNWEIIKNIINNLNIDVYLKILLNSYLTNRSVLVKGTGYSFGRFIGQGCPQGSILGPLLWLILANEILKSFDGYNGRLLAYADDFLYLYPANNRRELEIMGNIFLERFTQVLDTYKLQISLEKTTAIIFGRDLSRRNPLIKIKNRTVKISKSVKVLGLTIDSKLKFFDHLHNLKTELMVYLANLSKMSTPYWGINSELIKIWYVTAIEPKILYASEIYYPYLNVHGRRRLTSLQRLFLIKIGKTYRTVSTDALQVITGIPPIVLRAELKYKLFQFKNNKVSLIINEQEINIDMVERKELKYNRDPVIDLSNLKIITTGNGQLKKNISNIDLFTDGSKLENNVGLAIIKLDNENVSKYMYKLKNWNSVYQAEAMAIKIALEMSICEGRHFITIYTDSLSVCYSLQNLFPKSAIIKDIQQLCSQHLEKNIEIIWIRAHKGNVGNELADLMAKKGTKFGVQLQVRIPEVVIKNKLKCDLINDWQNLWHGSESGRYTYNIKSYVGSDFILKNNILNYFLTNHGSFPQYLFKLNKLNSPYCPCGELGSGLHYLRDSCEYIQENIKLASNETLLAYFKRIDNNRFLVNLTKRIYNKLNSDFSFIYSKF